MKFLSTRNSNLKISGREAIVKVTKRNDYFLTIFLQTQGKLGNKKTLSQFVAITQRFPSTQTLCHLLKKSLTKHLPISTQMVQYL